MFLSFAIVVPISKSPDISRSTALVILILIMMSYNESKSFPRNLPDRVLAPYALEAIGQELDTQAPRLFSNEAQAALEFLDLGKIAGGMVDVIYTSFLSTYFDRL